jgi:hypothetical protein
MREYRLHYNYERIGVRAVQATSAAEASKRQLTVFVISCLSLDTDFL